MNFALIVALPDLFAVGGAMAQTTYSQTTTTQSTTAPLVMKPAPIAPPPDGVLATERTQRAVDAYGNQTVSKESTYRDESGVARDTQSTTTTVPPVATTNSSTPTTTTIR